MQDSVERMWAMLVELGRVRSLRDPFAGVGDGDLTAAQRHAVFWLGVEGTLPVTTLAHRIGSPVPACTGVVDRLEKLGIVQRDRGVDDRRVVHVSLTESGAELHQTLRTAITDHLAGLLAPLSDDDRTALLDILGRLSTALANSASSPDPKTSP